MEEPFKVASAAQTEDSDNNLNPVYMSSHFVDVFTLVIRIMFCITQLIFSIKILIHSRKIKEIRCLVKLMTILANWTQIAFCAASIINFFYKYQMEDI